MLWYSCLISWFEKKNWYTELVVSVDLEQKIRICLRPNLSPQLICRPCMTMPFLEGCKSLTYHDFEKSTNYQGYSVNFEMFWGWYQGRHTFPRLSMLCPAAGAGTKSWRTLQTWRTKVQRSPGCARTSRWSPTSCWTALGWHWTWGEWEHIQHIMIVLNLIVFDLCSVYIRFICNLIMFN